MAKGIILIEVDRCKGCALCVDACPKDLIEIDTTQPNARGYYPARLVDPENACTGCGLCAVACPDVGIRVYRQPKTKRGAASAPAAQ